MVRAGAANQYPEIKVYMANLPFSYVDAEKKALGSTGRSTRTTRGQKEKHGLSKVLPLFPESRRERPIILSFLAQFNGANRVHHLVAALQRASKQLVLIGEKIRRLSIQGDSLAHYLGKGVQDPATPLGGSVDRVIRTLFVAHHMATLFQTKRILKRVKQPLINPSGHAITAIPRKLGYVENMNDRAHTAKRRGHLLETNRWVTE